MSKTSTPVLSLILTSLCACASARRVEPRAESACAAGGEIAPSSDADRTLYALGVFNGQRLRPFALNARESALVARGMLDALAGGGRSVDMRAMTPRIQALADERAAIASRENLRRGEAFAVTAATQPGARRLDSGIVFRTVAEGTGASPSSDRDTVTVRYRGTLIDGTEFDASRDAPLRFALDAVIPCWSEAISRMRAGGRAQFVCPASLSYGERAHRLIPPGSTLVFEVELISVAPPSSPETAPAQGEP